MRLDEVLQNLEKFDESAVLCVRRPWAPGAECFVVAPDVNLGVPNHVKLAGGEYFMEVSVAREVLAVFEKPATLQAKVDLLLYYAENDAYPDWVYDNEDEM